MFKNQSHQYQSFARVLLIYGMAFFIAGALGLQSTAAKPRTHTVAIRGINYVPATFSVNVGDTVVWKNEDTVPHTATDKGKSFDSGSIVSAAKPGTHTVAIRGMNYVPATLTVNVGDTVVWKNEDTVPHTATDKGKSFDSGSIVSSASWSYVVQKKGTYSYYCTFHPNMNGKLIVR